MVCRRRRHTNKKAVREMDSLYSSIQNLCFPFGAVIHLQHALHLHGHWHHWERKFVVHAQYFRQRRGVCQ
ncbi:MAG: hypothetical protein UZ14_CFX002002087 [Chloroflexi bacterium OLB14]|nr:MAG: hypothetical protein UZ14_CFX002002087 [Chloroflexi bacterium OLB14]